MPTTVVVYRSISGFTKKYAEWIAQECKADLFDARTISTEKLLEYSIIIFGGSLHAVGINGLNLVKESLPKLMDKKIVVFAVGASPPTEGILSKILERNFSGIDTGNLKLFYLRGGFNFGKLDLTNKILMALFRVRISFKKKKTPDEKGMLAAYSKPIDCTRRENIRELVDYINRQNNHTLQ
jgi:menaquinone-dependent protoporphyrinogen IX oxidase